MVNLCKLPVLAISKKKDGVCVHQNCVLAIFIYGFFLYFATLSQIQAGFFPEFVVIMHGHACFSIIEEVSNKVEDDAI